MEWVRLPLKTGLQEHAQSGLGAPLMRPVRSTAGTVAQHSAQGRLTGQC